MVELKIVICNKGYGHYFNYEAMYQIYNKEMEDVWILPAVSMNEKKYGKHPTQKPECLLERIVLASTQSDYLVLDPFMGSGTTGAVCKKLGRKFIGIELNKKYYELATNRILSS